MPVSQLPGILGLERRGLQFHDDVATQFQMIEQQVDEEFVATDLQPVLTGDKGEAGS